MHYTYRVHFYKVLYCCNNRSYIYFIQTAFLTEALKEMLANSAGIKVTVCPIDADVHWLLPLSAYSLVCLL